MMEYWSVGELESQPPIIPILQHSNIPPTAEISNAVAVISVPPAQHRILDGAMILCYRYSLDDRTLR
jgi:hypothetical protein